MTDTPNYVASQGSISAVQQYVNGNVAANNTFANGLADVWNQDAYSRLSWDRALSNMDRVYGRSRSQLPGAYASRGVMRSGMYGRGLSNLMVDAYSGLVDSGIQHGIQQDQINSAWAGLGNQRTDSLAANALQRQADQSNTASMISGVA